jgi:NAD(P)-dependent dehydrogenase (short-subunit alcohol dehydrogenase family)
MVDETVGRYGQLDVLVNNAAVLHLGTMLETTVSDWDRLMAINIRAAAFACAAAIRHMRGRGGTIVNVASVVALCGEPRLAAYAASKGALVSLTKALAIDHVRENIRVNCLCPGSTRTPLTDLVLDGDTGEGLRNLETILPMGRQASAQEVASGVLFLASDESSYMTGSALPMEGGFMLGWRAAAAER